MGSRAKESEPVRLRWSLTWETVPNELMSVLSKVPVLRRNYD